VEAIPDQFGGSVSGLVRRFIRGAPRRFGKVGCDLWRRGHPSMQPLDGRDMGIPHWNRIPWILGEGNAKKSDAAIAAVSHHL
jgi:hypothetical protein